MMGEITDFVQLYIDQSDIIPDKLDEIAGNLQENIKDNLWVGHGLDTGELFRNIASDSKLDGKIGIVTAWYTRPYGEYVDIGHTLRNGEWWEGYHFMDEGLAKTLEAYR